MTAVRPDRMSMIKLDECVSASGVYRCVLASRWEAALDGQTCFYMVTYINGTNHVHKIHRFSIGDATIAFTKWFDWVEKFAKVDPTKRYEDEMPASISCLKYSPPYLIPEDSAVLKMKPMGARIFVRDIVPVDEMTARAEKAGIVAVIAEENKPKPTMGIVLKVGEDPLAQELYRPGQIVMFSRYAGNTFSEGLQQYRSLELHEVIGSRLPEDGLEDLMPPTRAEDPDIPF